MKNKKDDDTNHALAIARKEDNSLGWLEGNYFGLSSKRQRLQKLVGDGGTLWIVVSRRKPGGGRLYSLSFQLKNCRSKTLKSEGRFGKYAVFGDPLKSTLYASNDASLLLMSLRFNPSKPIRDIKKVGYSIQTPRSLSYKDIDLLKYYQAKTDRWSVFVSYQSGDQKIAKQVSENLQRIGVNTFLDGDSIRAGENWKQVLLEAIERARCLVLIIGQKTHNSKWVKKELSHASKNNVYIIPALVDGNIDNWSSVEEVSKLQVIKKGSMSLKEFSMKIARNLPSFYY